MKEIRIGVVGCGSIAEIAHFPRITENPETQLIAVCDVDEERAQDAARKWGAERHYAEHKGKSFYELLLSFMCAEPSVILILEGPHAIPLLRLMMGATNPLHAVPGSIRGDYADNLTYNLIHGSDSPETAEREIALFFDPEELVSYPG